MHRLRDDVLHGIFKPGEDLREFALSKRYGVSRSPIRDALLQLTQEGLLVATPNCGVKVGSPIDEEVQPLVIEIRRKVELFAVERLINKLKDSDLYVLQRQLERNREACKAGALPGIIKTDMDFHQSIVELNGLTKLLGVWKQVTSSMMLHYERLHNWMDNYAEHEAIFEAIKKVDKKAAKAALSKNIR